MNLARLAAERMELKGPIGVAVIGAGKFGSMFLAQAPTSPGMRVVAIADLDVDRAKRAAVHVGWDDAYMAGCTFTNDGAAAITRDDVEVVVEATGNPAAGIRHALAAIEHGKHIVMVNVEADVLAGAALAKRARAAGVVYTLAYGDQPALVAEQVDWARSCGFAVTAAGKGTKYMPDYHASTPDEVWHHFGIAPERAIAAGMNPQMFNSFVDGTKSAIEMVAIANACDLAVPSDGLTFPPVGADELAEKLRPAEFGGLLEGRGMVETVSSLNRDGTEVARDLRWGVYVVFEALTDYAASCFEQYGLKTDSTGRFASMYRPYHLIGLELGVSVLSAALRGEATGSNGGFRGDAVAVAKRSMKKGEMLDGEGGYTVWGKAWPGAKSLAYGALPIGLAHRVPLTRDIPEGTVLTWNDVAIGDNQAVSLRREAEGLG
jgi:predicted homoserine dehydrogenase-like protein